MILSMPNKVIPLEGITYAMQQLGYDEVSVSSEGYCVFRSPSNSNDVVFLDCPKVGFPWPLLEATLLRQGVNVDTFMAHLESI